MPLSGGLHHMAAHAREHQAVLHGLPPLLLVLCGTTFAASLPPNVAWPFATCCSAATRRRRRCSSATTRSWGRPTRWVCFAATLGCVLMTMDGLRGGAPAVGQLWLATAAAAAWRRPGFPPCLPPAQVIIDTNFINFSIRNKIDLVKVRSCCSQHCVCAAWQPHSAACTQLADAL